MKHYLYYRPTGVIAWKAECDDDDEPEQHEGLTLLVLDGPLVGNEWHVEGGVLAAGALDLRTLDDRRAGKWEAIKAIREAWLYAPLITPFGIFDCDAASQENILRADMLAQRLKSKGLPSTITFTMYDNTRIEHTADAMESVAFMVGARIQTMHAYSGTVRGAIAAASTAEEVDAIVWPGG